MSSLFRSTVRFERYEENVTPSGSAHTSGLRLGKIFSRTQNSEFRPLESFDFELGAGYVWVVGRVRCLGKFNFLGVHLVHASYSTAPQGGRLPKCGYAEGMREVRRRLIR